MHNVVSVLANLWVGFYDWVDGIHPFACNSRWITSVVLEDISKETIVVTARFKYAFQWLSLTVQNVLNFMQFFLEILSKPLVWPPEGLAYPQWEFVSV